jgi:hypothetical protein
VGWYGFLLIIPISYFVGTIHNNAVSYVEIERNFLKNNIKKITNDIKRDE